MLAIVLSTLHMYMFSITQQFFYNTGVIFLLRDGKIKVQRFVQDHMLITGLDENRSG